MSYLIGLLVAAVAGLLYQKSKRDSAEAVLVNNDVIKEDNKLSSGIDKNNALLQAEEEKRKEKTNEDNLDAIADHFNKPPHS